MNISPASLLLGIADFKSQALNLLTNPTSDFKKDFLSALLSPQQALNNASTDALSLLTGSSGVTGLSPTGRNMALFDPESAYKMMSVINNRDATYKAQFSEVSQMQSGVTLMQDAGRSLGSIAPSASNDDIKSQLQGFTDQYNWWIQRFNPDVQKGGLLADTQAAQVSVYELEQSVKNIFNGAKDGVHGLRDLGISIDPHTKLATLDIAKLDAILTTNKQGVVDTVQEFSVNFSKSAGLLNAAGNFIPNQLNNLNKVIHYVADNKADLQAEFGTGDSAKPTGQIAKALAAYNQTYGV
jgi:hypothetical protein